MSNYDTAGKACYERVRRRALERLGSICVRCGFSDWRALQIDHIHGGSKEDFNSIRPGLRSSTYSFLKHILLLSDEELHQKYQLLCANCNWIKRYEKDEWRDDYGDTDRSIEYRKQRAGNYLNKHGLSVEQVIEELKKVK